MQLEVHITVQTQGDEDMNWGRGSRKKGLKRCRKVQKRKGALKGNKERMNKLRE